MSVTSLIPDSLFMDYSVSLFCKSKNNKVCTQ
uniref:Uncharacterized protein n=1 Tax=Siphoviridae sp. ctlHU7 TaxID=2827588 RepID=A0A8S5LIL0_9CAUD|nr:MAG TPA: hypothetical protein [Siphoviridae sp. ctlHU7]